MAVHDIENELLNNIRVIVEYVQLNGIFYRNLIDY